MRCPAARERRACPRAAGSLSGHEQLLEPARVDSLGLGIDPVARRACQKDAAIGIRRERAAQARNVHLHALGGCRRRRVTPQLVHDALDGHNFAGAEHQQREQLSLLRPAQCDRAAANPDLHRPENAHHQRIRLFNHRSAADHTPTRGHTCECPCRPHVSRRWRTVSAPAQACPTQAGNRAGPSERRTPCSARASPA